MITSRRQSHIVQRGAVISWIRLLKDEPYPDAHRPQPGKMTYPEAPRDWLVYNSALSLSPSR